MQVTVHRLLSPLQEIAAFWTAKGLLVRVLRRQLQVNLSVQNSMQCLHRSWLINIDAC